MNKFLVISLLAVWMAVVGVVALVVTMSSWDAHIEGKAFHCTDGDFPFFWTDMATHKAAGDALSPGWTWEKIEGVRRHYVGAFLLIWASISGVPVLFLIYRSRRPRRAQSGAAGSFADNSLL